MRRLMLKYTLICAIISLPLAHGLAQGAKGKVYWLEGNHMPGPEHSRRVKQGVVREIFFYPLASMKNVTMEGWFVSDMPGKPLARVRSRRDGSFKVRLKPGTYSVLVNEKGKLYANLFDGEGNIFPVTIPAKKYADLTILIDYEAAY